MYRGSSGKSATVYSRPRRAAEGAKARWAEKRARARQQARAVGGAVKSGERQALGIHAACCTRLA